MSLPLSPGSTSAPNGPLGLILPARLGVQGEYVLRVWKAGNDGQPLGPALREMVVPNLITNFGMDTVAFPATGDSPWGECVVGTGTTPPANSDTALAVFRGATTTVTEQGTVTRQVVTSPRWVQVQRTWRFAAGVANGNLTEVGIRRTFGTPANLYSRALIVDAGGAPTTLPLQPDEILDVSYRLRWFIPEADVTGNVTIKGVPTTWTMRPVAIHQEGVNATGGLGWPCNVIWGVSRGVRAVHTHNVNTSSSTNAVSTSGMVAMDQVPVFTTPSERGANGHQTLAYTPGSFTVDSVQTWGITTGNATGIQLATLSCEFGSFQVGFNPGFTKLSTEQLRLTLRVMWARRP